MKEHIYSTDEYEVKIGDPVVDAEVKASSTSVAIPCEAIPDGKYLVSLEVNGTAVAYRDTFSFASGSCTVGDYTLAYSSYAVTVSTTSNNDVVRLKVEPVEVYVTDAMKAAVAKVAPEAPTELPAITAADDGKVLTANSGVWGASYLYGTGRRIQIEATYSNGAYSTSTQLTPNEIDAGIVQGYDFQLFINNIAYRMYLVNNEGGDFANFKVTTSDGTLSVIMNGFDGEYATITIVPAITDFIVTLTPTALDYSGTMDKTVAEIDAAYNAGQEIVFRLYTAASVYIDVPVQLVSTDTDYEYPSFETNVTSASNNVFIFAQTGTTNDGTKATYGTHIYTLTPAT